LVISRHCQSSFVTPAFDHPGQPTLTKPDANHPGAVPTLVQLIVGISWDELVALHF